VFSETELQERDLPEQDMSKYCADLESYLPKHFTGAQLNPNSADFDLLLFLHALYNTLVCFPKLHISIIKAALHSFMRGPFIRTLPETDAFFHWLTDIEFHARPSYRLQCAYCLRIF
jgi:hypothetical protein